MITTQKATEKLKENLVKRCFDVGLGFRLISNGHGSSPQACSMKMDQKCPGDEVVEMGGIRIYLDPVSASEVKNYELDYIDEPGGGFCLKTPGKKDITNTKNK